jgi:hypothetical protein
MPPPRAGRMTDDDVSREGKIGESRVRRNLQCLYDSGAGADGPESCTRTARLRGPTNLRELPDECVPVLDRSKVVAAAVSPVDN